jgi:peptidoglycan/xylan/chitin deacetylase (PgdA/CDA1 family)
MSALLVGEELPAAIAFGGPLPAPLAASFAAACYTLLAEGAAVDLAVTAGRSALAERSTGRGWGFPQLRLLPGAELLFVSSQVGSVRRVRQQPVATARRRQQVRGARRQSARSQPAGGLPFLRWMLFSVAMLLVLMLALAGRSLGARGDAQPGADGVSQAGLSIAQPTTAPGAAPSSATAAPPIAEPPTPPAGQVEATAPVAAAEPPAGYATVMTGPNDSLELIAARMGSEAAAIANLNHLALNEPLLPDHPLVVPLFRPGVAGAGGLIIKHGRLGKPQVALTFDIEIDEASLYAILDILRARGVHGTFFLTGRWVQAFPDAARAIVREGHEVGNHSYSHPYFSRIGLDGAAAELEETERIIRETTGVTSRPYFRFPYGDSTSDTTALVAQQGYVAYHWSADDVAISNWLDWAVQHKAEAGGGILLMHGRGSTVEALPGWLDRLAELGLQPTTLGEVLK